jgi:ribosomal protein S18 acetylase RimI-like enzyme
MTDCLSNSRGSGHRQWDDAVVVSVAVAQFSVIRHHQRPSKPPAALARHSMTSPAVRIRHATIGDAEDVAAMCHALSRDEGSDAPNHFSADDFRRDGFGADPAFSCLIAEDGGRSIGYAMHCSDYDTDRLCRSVYLADLYVEKAARRRGIGRALMAAAAKEGRRKGARCMMWGVLRDNRLARRFYAGIGRECPDLIEGYIGVPELTGLARDHGRPKDLAVRRALPGDAGLLAGWLRALLDDIGEPPPPPDAEARLRDDGFGADPAFTAVIAERAGVALGYALYWPTHDTESAARGLWLSDLYVAPGARRDGVGRILMAALARAAIDSGARFIVWLVLERNAKARAFYRTIGREWHDGFPCVCAGAAFERLAAQAPPIG